MPLYYLWHRRDEAAIEHLAKAFEFNLGYPRSEALRKAKKQAFYDTLSILEFATFTVRSTADLITDGLPAPVINNSVLPKLASDPRPIIFASVHMGAYILGMSNLIYHHFQGRKILILRNHANNEEHTKIFSRIADLGCEVRSLDINDKASFVDALRFVRSNSIIVSFVDLPGTYGVPVDVELFGKPARIAMGIEVMARALNATVLPMNVKSYLGHDVITLRTPFEVGPPSAQERQRIMNIVVRHIQDSVLEEPEQWHMLGRLEEFFVARGDATAAQDMEVRDAA